MSDGGPAFARPDSMAPGGGVPGHRGMTLRDYFAAAALQGMSGEYAKAMCDQTGRHWLVEQSLCSDQESEYLLADMAYELADAMLAARDQTDA